MSEIYGIVWMPDYTTVSKALKTSNEKLGGELFVEWFLSIRVQNSVNRNNYSVHRKTNEVVHISSVRCPIIRNKCRRHTENRSHKIVFFSHSISDTNTKSMEKQWRRRRRQSAYFDRKLWPCFRVLSTEAPALSYQAFIIALATGCHREQ